MPDFRVYCVPENECPTELRLSAEESHHLVVVNRARRGDPVVAFDGRGREWECELASEAKNAAVLAVLHHRQTAPFSYEITLAQALPKGQSMDGIIRKATEIGARHVVPLTTERTQVHLDGERQDRKVEKWRTAALEAAKQCGNPFLPDVSPLLSLEQFLQASGGSELKLIASLHPGARALKSVWDERRTALGRKPLTAAWLVGPEGDFSPGEVERAIAAGFQPVTLGPLVLRCETAAVYALSVLTYELQNG